MQSAAEFLVPITHSGEIMSCQHVVHMMGQGRIPSPAKGRDSTLLRLHLSIGYILSEVIQRK